MSHALADCTHVSCPCQAELLEDAEASVEARAAEVVRQLEELSGESLAEYLK